MPSGVVGALYLVSLSSLFLFLPHLPSLGNVKIYPLLSPQRRALFVVHLLPSTLSSSTTTLHLLHKEAEGRWQAGRPAAETADAVTEQNSLCEVGGAERCLGSGLLL